MVSDFDFRDTRHIDTIRGILARRRRKFLGFVGVLQSGNRVENVFPGRLRAAGAKNSRLRR